MFEILDDRPVVVDRTGAVDLGRAKGLVRFERVGFGYEADRPVLHGIDLEVEPGQVVAIMGAPGSGKSTLVSLLPRFYDVSSGRVTIDGKDVRDVTTRSLRSNIGIVQQDVFLFSASLGENIAYGHVDASEEELSRVVELAMLGDFVDSLDAGLATPVAERGASLSGGQRQRVVIARTLLLDPPLLILDDSTSSVDADTEHRLRRALETVMVGRTTFVIAHRLSTVERADLVLVLDGGRIVERGTHGELLAAGGIYRRLFELHLRPRDEAIRRGFLATPRPGYGSART